MFAFDATNRAGFDDFRPAVHDSDGLQMLTGAGEWLWRPLANPRDLQISAFQDRNPRDYYLTQSINNAIAGLGQIESPRGAWQFSKKTHSPVLGWKTSSPFPEPSRASTSSLVQ